MATEPPALPDADGARRWAVEELAKAEYRDAAPTWLEAAWRNFVDWFSSLEGSPDSAGALPSPVIGIVIAFLIATAVILARPRLNAASRQQRDIFEPDSALTAADYRTRAEAAAAAENWGDAVVDRFRALVATAETRVILDPQPGRTADEVARDLAVPFPADARRLDGAAKVFDGIRYGNRPAASTDYQDMVALDTALEAAKPAPRQPQAVLP